MKTLFSILLVLIAITAVHAQEAKRADTKSSEKEEQITIPTNLAEAHNELERLLPADELTKIDSMKTEGDMIKYHFGLGMGLRNRWGLWGDSPMARYMKSLGFTHPDEMSSMILETFWCKRHGKEIKLEERIAEKAESNAIDKAFKSQWPGENIVDPIDKSKVIWSMGYRIDGKLDKIVCFGKSTKTGRWLAFDKSSGVFVPDQKLMDDVRAAGGRFEDGVPEVIEMTGDPLDPFLEGNPKTQTNGEQGGAGQSATRPESKRDGDQKPQPKSEGRSR